MRILRYWVAIAIVAFLVLLLGGKTWLNDASLPPLPGFSSVAVSSSHPTIDADRILEHLQSLSFVRYGDRDRQQARHYITEQLTTMGWQVQEQPFETGINLYAERLGTTPTAGSILVAAHYDTVARSPGADDNASGVVAVLEVAQLLYDSPTERTLKLALFDKEEAGLLGSLAFVQEPAMIDDIEGAIILDMIGYTCQEPGCQTFPANLPIELPSDQGTFLAVIGDRAHPGLIGTFESLTTTTIPLFTLAIPTQGNVAPDLTRSDHAPFWNKNIGAVMLTDTANFRNPHYHQPSDQVDTLDPDFLTGTVQILVDVVFELLSNPEPLNLR